MYDFKYIAKCLVNLPTITDTESINTPRTGASCEESEKSMHIVPTTCITVSNIKRYFKKQGKMFN